MEANEEKAPQPGVTPEEPVPPEETEVDTDTDSDDDGDGDGDEHTPEDA